MTHRRPEHFHIRSLKRTYNRQTNTFTVDISYETAPPILTERTKEVAEAFGLGADQSRKFQVFSNQIIGIKPTDVVLITGDSGSGKSALLKALKQDLGGEAQDIRDLKINPDTPIIETIGKNTTEAIQALSQVGLNDAFLFLRSYSQLSDGQKHRYQIALLAATDKPFWLLDEFTSTLDRDTAKIVAFNLQRLARKMGKAVIAATTQRDLLRDFAPNVHIHKRYGKEVAVKYHPKAKASACSLTRQMTIQPGTTADYKALSGFHYRAGRLPPPRKIFTLKRKGELCGVVVYSFPPPMSFGRRKVWSGSIAQLQREVSVVSRVVVHPKYRSIGLGEKLVRDTLIFAGTRCVEAVAVMAKYNPFFERAGLRKIAESVPSQALQDAIFELEQLGFDAALLGSTIYNQNKIMQVGAQPILQILNALSQRDGGVRRRVAHTKNLYPRHTEFQEKISHFTPQQLAEALKTLSFACQTKTYLFWKSEIAVDRCGLTSRLCLDTPFLRSYPHPLERITSKLRLPSPESSRVRLLNSKTVSLRKPPADRQPQRTDSQCFGYGCLSSLGRLIRRCQPAV